MDHTQKQRFVALQRATIVVIVYGMMACAAAVQPAPVFYLSTQSADATPGLLNLANVPVNSTGILHIWADTDVRLSGVSLDLVETGGAIKFTGLEVHNPFLPGSRWPILDGPREVTDSDVNNIGGFLLPGPFGLGIGPGVPDGPRVTLASVDYMALNTPGAKSDLSLRVGHLTITDFDGSFPQIRFGTINSPLINGGAIGSAGAVGSITLGGSFAPVITPVHLGEIEQATTIRATLYVPGPFTWSGLTSVAGSPALPATLTPSGAFSWDPTGSKRGPKGNGMLYSWSATVTNAGGSTSGIVLTLRLIPEPATMTQFSLAIFGLLAFAHRLASE